jgi:hypothetical protein
MQIVDRCAPVKIASSAVNSVLQALQFRQISVRRKLPGGTDISHDWSNITRVALYKLRADHTENSVPLFVSADHTKISHGAAIVAWRLTAAEMFTSAFRSNKQCQAWRGEAQLLFLLLRACFEVSVVQDFLRGENTLQCVPLCFNILELCNMITESICRFLMILTINSDYFPIKH